MRLLLAAVVGLGAACAEDAGPIEGAGGEGGGGAGGCVASVRVGTLSDPLGENSHFAAVTDHEQVEIATLEGQDPFTIPGHIWTGLLVRGFDPDRPLAIKLENFREDGTPYGGYTGCYPKLGEYTREVAGWREIVGLRSFFAAGTMPMTDLPGHSLRIRATVDDGIDADCMDPDPATATCTAAGEMLIDPLPPL